MKKAASIISYAALVLLITAPALFYVGLLSLEQNKLILLIATVIWFVSASISMGVRGEKKS